MSSTDELRQFNQALISEFRANGGQVSGWEDNPLLLLTTIGAKSGHPHTTPLSYMTDNDRIIVLAANQGALSHPHWYNNLVVHPDVTVELGEKRWTTRAVVAEGQERERLFNLRAAQAPWVAEYQSQTKRQIPVVILAHVPPGSSL
jgi:deazaflavin-dependent oxidoreductase (nitroreductase family)